MAEHEQYNALRYKSLKGEGALCAQMDISLWCKHQVEEILIEEQINGDIFKQK